MSGSAEVLHDTLTEHIAAHDRDAAVCTAIDAVRTEALSIPELYDLLATMLVEVGASWQAGETEVWQEHFATAVVRTIIEACHALVAERAPAPNGRTVVLATPPDEYHDLGLRMTSDRFELAGWTTHVLGASVPAEELARAVTALGADAVVLSASTHFHRLALRPYVDVVRAAHPNLQVWVGGAAFAQGAEDWSPETLLDPTEIPSLADRVG